MKLAIIILLTLISSCSKKEYSNDTAFSRIQNRKELRVGMTGDYKPFSYKNSNTGKFKGIDVDIAKVIADKFKVKLVFVETSWPKLMNDLASDKFDIAISGITKTIEREKVASFSTSYFPIGKTPVTRCEDVEKYNSLEKINNKNVTLLFNEGGTNHKYARDHVSSAKHYIVKTNHNILNNLKNKTADVMITDSVEANYYIRRDDSLCRSMPHQLLTKSDIAIMMKKDASFRYIMNTVLDEMREKDNLKNLIIRHLKK